MGWLLSLCCLFIFLYVRTLIVGDSEENAEKKVWDEKFAKKCHILLVYEENAVWDEKFRKVPQKCHILPVYDFPFYLELHECPGGVRSILSVLWAPMGVPFPFYLGFDENMPNFAMSCQKKSRLHPLQMISHSICVSRVWGGPFYLWATVVVHATYNSV